MVLSLCVWAGGGCRWRVPEPLVPASITAGSRARCAPGTQDPSSQPPSPVLPAGLDSGHVQGQGAWLCAVLPSLSCSQAPPAPRQPQPPGPPGFSGAGCVSLASVGTWASSLCDLPLGQREGRAPAAFPGTPSPQCFRSCGGGRL